MQTVEEIYTKSIRPLPESDQRRLASLILKEVTKRNVKSKIGQNGKLSDMFGIWQGKMITKEEYQELDHNERIDFDLAQEYADKHEDED